MYRDIPCTPLSFCSVHSRVTCRRTSFFLLAAVTTSAPRERSLALAADGRAASELVEQTLARAAFSETHVETLEGWIDGMDAELPALSSFLLVSGGKASVFLHQARVVCRRAERRCVPLVRSGAVPDVVRVYLNRLSDYMFTAARFAAMKAGREEEAYKKSTAN